MASTLEPSSLARAQTIRAQLDARYRVVRGRGLAVTEASATGVIESFTLLTADLLETRLLPAENGIYYAICPVRASCPYPAPRFTRPAADLFPRRLALELALRTFLETSADVVAVSLPTARFILFVVEREELPREVDLSALAEALDRDPSRPLSSSLKVLVDRVTRPRVYVALGLESTPSRRDTLVAMPRWPVVSANGEDTAPAAAAGSGTASWANRDGKVVRRCGSLLLRDKREHLAKGACGFAEADPGSLGAFLEQAGVRSTRDQQGREER
jgi:hypothetical protein